MLNAVCVGVIADYRRHGSWILVYMYIISTLIVITAKMVLSDWCHTVWFPLGKLTYNSAGSKCCIDLHKKYI